MIEVLKQDIVQNNLSFVISKWVIEKVPFIFEDNLELYIQWKEQLSSKIKVDSKAMTLVGSAAVGFSLNPSKEMRAFNEDSDIDVAIISQHYFDISWHFLRNLENKLFGYSKKIQFSIADHKSRLIYWGIIATDKILQILPFGESWIIALNEMRKVKPTIDREINIRIYKDFEALRAYSANNLRNIKDILISNHIPTTK